MATTTSTALKFTNELRVDSSDGKPYTLQSFIETYENGQELWDKAKVWGEDGILRIRTCDSVPKSTSASSIHKGTQLPAAVDFRYRTDDFPSGLVGSPKASTTTTRHGRFNYSQIVESASPCHSDSRESSLSPNADEWSPDASAAPDMKYDYSQDTMTTNDEFSQLATDLWSGNELFMQPPEDIESINIDWATAIRGWTPEEWREFGIKYFYGYVQQSTLLLDKLNETECQYNEAPVGAWGDE